MNEAPEPKPKHRPKSPPRQQPTRSTVGGSPFDLFDRRRRRIETFERGNPSARRDMALAMCEFDRRTDPAQLSHDGEGPNAKLILDITQYLIHRVKQRAGYGVQRRPFEPTPIPPFGDASGLREQIRDVEKIFRSALQKAFPPKVGKVFPIRQFERTFAAFTGGEIGLGSMAPVTAPDDLALHGMPDGANYYCFAEAALLFLHCRIGTSFWTPLLRTFVGGTQYFAASYWNRSDRTWAAYRAGNPRTPVPSPVILATVDHFHAAMDISQLAAHFTEIVGLALRDEPTLPQPSITAKELQ